MSASDRVVVVGGVAAGMSAASQVKRRQPKTEVVVFERGPFISYGACGMPYNIADPERSMDDLLVLSVEDAREDRGIDVRVGHDVQGIDLERGVVTVRDIEAGRERHEPFDALVLATGARAVTLSLPGMDLPGVEVMRDLGDGMRVKEAVAAGASRAAIIGGGYIGLEMAHVLTERGLEVQVLERMPQIIPGWSQETAKLATEELERHGVIVRCGVSVQGVEAGADGRAAAVLTDAGEVTADLVLVAVGVRPNVDLAAAAGLRVGDSGAIWVTLEQQTSHEAVWAAGDCAEAYHRILRRNVWIPLGTTANKQGRVAGANIAGERQVFRGVVGTAGFVAFDLELAHTGLSAEEATNEGFEPESVAVRQRSRAHGYPGGTPVHVTLVADGPTGLLLGGEIVGKEGAALRSDTLATALAAHMTVADLQALDLAYAPPFAPVWDPLLVAANQLAKKVGRKG